MNGTCAVAGAEGSDAVGDTPLAWRAACKAVHSARFAAANSSLTRVASLRGRPSGFSMIACTRPGRLGGPVNEATRTGGGSDDIGDVSWSVPTINFNYPSNIPGMPGHNWANAIAMATPIAHKGVVQGAKVQAMTILDILHTPQMVTDAWDYFNTVQTKDIKYKSFFAPTDQPPIWLNADIMAQFRPEMRKYYYDPKKFKTYLEQLGIEYPTVRKPIQ